MNVHVGHALGHDRGVHAQRAGGVFEHPVGVSQHHPELACLVVVEVFGACDVADGLNHHPARETVGRWCVPDEPTVCLRDNAVDRHMDAAVLTATATVACQR